MLGRILLITLLMMGMIQTSSAQKISVESFQRVKKDLLNQLPLPTEKKQATLDFLTSEQGFKFKADGKTDIQAEEGDGKLTLLAPHKTKFIVIEHPDYGQYTWKVPGKGLRKKRHYQANLITDKPGKEYKLAKQWVVIEVDPQNAIVEVDSTTVRVRDGLAQLNVTIGRHPYRVEAPFHVAVEDTLEVTDSVKLILPVTLQPIYSYLTVRTPMENGRIVLDGHAIGTGSATSGHLAEGNHRLQVFRKLDCYYDGIVSIGKAEKKVVEIAAEELWKRPRMVKVPIPAVDTTQVATMDSVLAQPAEGPVMADVTITAPDDSTQIWVNREPKGLGKWEGKLQQGYYAIQTEKEGLVSGVIPFWVNDAMPKTLDLSMPQASYGLLNIHSNVIGATVKVNGVTVGETPCVVDRLPAAKACRVSLVKKGYLNKEVVVTPIGNDMLDIELMMVKR